MKWIIFFLWSSHLYAVDIFVIAGKRHMSFAIPIAQIPNSFFPGDIDYRKFEYLDLSMGQDPYFTEKNPSLLSGLKALLLTSPSLLRFHPFIGHPQSNYQQKSILKLTISDEEIQKLIQNTKIEIQGETKAKFNDHLMKKYFYKRNLEYRYNFTCVNWTIEKLKSAGIKAVKPNIFDDIFFPPMNSMPVFRKLLEDKSAQLIYDFEKEEK